MTFGNSIILSMMLGETPMSQKRAFDYVDGSNISKGKFEKQQLADPPSKKVKFLKDSNRKFPRPKPQPYKIQDVNRSYRVGIVAKSFQELVEKGIQKLHLEVDKAYVVVCTEEDGTVVDQNLFKKSPPNATFVFLLPNQSWNGYWRLLEKALDGLMSAGAANLAERCESVMGVERAEKYATMRRWIDRQRKDLHQYGLEMRQDDPDWFQGVDKRFTAKDEVMKESARRRIRAYLTKGREQTLKDCGLKYKNEVSDIFGKFQDLLKKNSYNGEYFSRNTDSNDAYCDEQGDFMCEGPFDDDSCQAFHHINPFRSREERIVFSTWNLDHVVERSRSVVPALVDAVKTRPGDQRVNWPYFYGLLFTRDNLKLVHVVCHKKVCHTNHACVKDKFFVA